MTSYFNKIDRNAPSVLARYRGTGMRPDSTGFLLRDNNAAPSFAKSPYGKRFCECCNRYRPKDKRPAFKGWKCAECSAQRA